MGVARAHYPPIPLPPHHRLPSSKPPQMGVRFEGCTKLNTGKTDKPSPLVLGTPQSFRSLDGEYLPKTSSSPSLWAERVRPRSCPPGRTERTAFTGINVKKSYRTLRKYKYAMRSWGKPKRGRVFDGYGARSEGDAAVLLASSINNDIFWRHWQSMSVKSRLGKHYWNGEKGQLFPCPQH